MTAEVRSARLYDMYIVRFSDTADGKGYNGKAGDA
jgi:hypothetical protein